MTSINIPIDAITSRFNFNSVAENFNAQSVSHRFANLRSVREFFDLKRISRPSSFGEAQSRINYNLSYFASNYLILALMITVYGLISNWALLFDICFVSSGLYIIRKLDGRDLELGFTRLNTAQLYTGLLVIGVPIFLFSGPFTTMLWLVGAIGVSVFGHASFMDKPIDTAFSEEAV
jgi:PRA1 family protein 1